MMGGEGCGSPAEGVRGPTSRSTRRRRSRCWQTTRPSPTQGPGGVRGRAGGRGVPDHPPSPAQFRRIPRRAPFHHRGPFPSHRDRPPPRCPGRGSTPPSCPTPSPPMPSGSGPPPPSPLRLPNPRPDAPLRGRLGSVTPPRTPPRRNDGGFPMGTDHRGGPPPNKPIGPVPPAGRRPGCASIHKHIPRRDALPPEGLLAVGEDYPLPPPLSHPSQ